MQVTPTKQKKKKPMGVTIWVACFDTNQLVKTREGWQHKTINNSLKGQKDCFHVINMHIKMLGYDLGAPITLSYSNKSLNFDESQHGLQHQTIFE